MTPLENSRKVTLRRRLIKWLIPKQPNFSAIAWIKKQILPTKGHKLLSGCVISIGNAGSIRKYEQESHSDEV
jgi:hypothetical protein